MLGSEWTRRLAESQLLGARCLADWRTHIAKNPSLGGNPYALQAWIGKWCDTERRDGSDVGPTLADELEPIEIEWLLEFMAAAAGHRRDRRPRSVIRPDDKGNLRAAPGHTCDAVERDRDPSGRSLEQLQLA